MIVDDEECVSKLLSRHLASAGFTNQEVISNSSVAAAHILRSSPDVLLLDIKMKPTDGLDILREIQADVRARHIPVIVVTSCTEESTKLAALNSGAIDFLTKPVAASELVARVRNTLSLKVYRDKVNSYTTQLESDLLSDSLTGVANRRAFDYELKRRIVEWDRQRTPLGMMMIDIDLFKQFNDKFGHDVGDNVLRSVAQRIHNSAREMDLVARYGGEEFAIVVPGTTARDVRKSAVRIHQLVANEPFPIGEETFHVTVSIGVASTLQGDDAEQLVRRADTALYHAKNSGRNCCAFHDGAECVSLTASTSSKATTSELRQDFAGSVQSARIAIVDDEPAVVAITKSYLKQSGFNAITGITDSTKVVETLEREEPDIVLLDVHMPEINGFEILRQLRSANASNPIAVLIFTSSKDADTKIKALELGATDFLHKPLNKSELIARVRNTLIARKQHQHLADYSNKLEHEVRLRTAELVASRREAIQCLARAAELRDDQTGWHVIRVGRYAATIARELGFSDERVIWIEHAAQLHDVGKIGIRDDILYKAGPLTADEFEVMKKHCSAGGSVIRHENDWEHTAPNPVLFADYNSPLMRMAAIVAETHHEKWDGTGYPRGLAGNDIPIEGRITAVADVFDALSTKRPYKEAIPLDECFEIMTKSRGTHFDPSVLDAFFRRKSEIINTYNDFSDESRLAAGTSSEAGVTDSG